MLCYNWNIAGYINLFSLASSLHNELHLLHLHGIKFPDLSTPKQTVVSTTKHQSAGIYIPINY